MVDYGTNDDGAFDKDCPDFNYKLILIGQSQRLALPIASSMTCSMRRNSKREPYRSRGK